MPYFKYNCKKKIAFTCLLIIYIHFTIFAYGENLKNENANYWDHFTRNLLAKYDCNKEPPSLEVEELLKMKEFEIKKQKSVLDLGSGLGKNSIPFLKNNCGVTLCDIS